MRSLGLVATAMAAVLAGLASFLLVVAPTEGIKDRLIASIKGQTGRTLSIKGAASMTFYPALGVRLNDVSLSAPDGVVGPDILRAAQLDLEIPLWPLLQRRIAVQRFVLKQPVLTLHTAPSGERNWDFASAKADAKPIPSANTALPASPGQSMAAPAHPDNGPSAGLTGISLAALGQLSLGDVQIDNGTVIVDDEAAGRTLQIGAINAALTLPSIHMPASVTGSVAWRGQTLPIALQIASPIDLAEGRSSAISLSSKSPLFDAVVDGELTLSAPPKLAGQVDIHSSSGAAALDWAGIVLPENLIAPSALRNWSVKGRIRADASELKLTEAILGLDQAVAEGDLTITPAAKRPMLATTLKVSGLALDALIAEPKAAADADDGRNHEPLLDFGWLNAIDADVKLSLVDLSWRGLLLDRGELTVTLRDRILKARLKDGGLHDGRGYGGLSIDGRNAAARIEVNATLQGVQLAPILGGLFDFRSLDGRGDVTGGILAIGQKRSELIAGLLGQCRIAVQDGAILGVNVPQIIRALQKGSLTGWDQEPQARTDFSTLTASFSVTKGVARNSDLVITGPLLRATGAGMIDLRQGTIDYAARPAVVASLVDPAARPGRSVATPSSLEIPMRIVGPLARPELQPDIGGIVRSVVSNPAAIVDALGGIGIKVPKAGDPKADAKPVSGAKPKPDLATSIGDVLSTLTQSEPAEAGIPSPSQPPP